ncbi:argininosuccinate lyase [Puniceicoccus vermicola]|uniref:Argininosuccinate lyase n=1 Tax=Puniceicoccus vermicola TaxID=388746 RepID=A0A7X1AVC6_9BACT|nr:argininosuccinate lyase [Puniceicoccus vermicola]MBC2600700.1 argininosuccinate lyase [Puniceicoccus vermicola]
MGTEKQVTWGGRFSGGPSERMQAFSESVSFDAELAPFDITGSRAQAAMLESIGILTADEKEQIDAGLVEIFNEIQAGQFTWDPALEDVHMNIEQALSARVPAAAKLHTARSRNDQVATDVRLYLRWAADELDRSLKGVLKSLVDLAEKHVDLLVPGYTHLQRGQPVSVAHHLLAYAEMFGRDRERFALFRERINVCPLGSGALAGTTLPIDREFVARCLGFVDENGEPRVSANSLDAVSDRDAPLEFCFNAALSGLHLSRFAEDFILWNSSEFGFVALPDAYTTGSSLMPQKKNPDALELIRGKAARLQGNLVTLQSMVKNLPLTYNRDLQEDKPPLFDSFRTLRDCLDVLSDLVPGIQFRKDRCQAAVSDPLLLATDLADYLVEQGVPFRQAHHQVGALVALSEKLDTPINELPEEEARKAADGLQDDWREVFSLERGMARRTGPGMPGPEPVRKAIGEWKTKLAD